MKIFLLISILLTTFLTAKTQIILGTFSKQSSADNVKKELNRLIQKDPKFKAFLDKNSIRTITKKEDKYFLVTLEPFLDVATQTAVLNKIKKTRFKDAYVLKLSAPTKKAIVEKPTKKPTQTKTIKKQPSAQKDEIILEKPEPAVEELKIDEIKVEEVKVKEVPVVQKVVIPVTQPQVVQKNFVQTYMTEIIAFIAILILIVAYIFFVRNKHKKEIEPEDSYEEIVEENEEIEEVIVDEYDQYDTEPVEESSEEEVVYELPESSEPIELDEEQLETQEQPDIVQEQPKSEDESTKLTSSIEKKEVPAHGKISKDNFKEFEGIRVMIAEDNLINQKVINGLLSESGIQLTIVDDGQEVLNQLEKDSDYCIILMDVHMPNMDGFEATKIIRSNPKYSHITVIALSGDIAPDDIANMRAAGMQENLEKPLKMDSLYDILYAYSYKNGNHIDLENNHEAASTDKELDIETGLEVCAGDEEFYKEILNDFLTNYYDSSKRIQDYLNNNEFDMAKNLIFDIGGVTANIGASNIQGLIKELKQALENTEDQKYISLFEKYATHFEKLKQEVKEYIS